MKRPVNLFGQVPCNTLHRCNVLHAGRGHTADAAKAVKVSANGLNNDLHGSAEYRAHLVSLLASRAVTAAG